MATNAPNDKDAVRAQDAAATNAANFEQEERRRRRLLLVLVVLLVLLAAVCGVLFGYVQRPRPLPDIVPLPVEVSYPPRFVYSIYGVEQPVGVALSPRGDRVYVAESGGERQIKIFDRGGTALAEFAQPRTRVGERSPVYLATDQSGRVFVTDRLQNAVVVFTADGEFLDAILAPTLTLSEYVAKHAAGLLPGDTFAFNVYERVVHFQRAGEAETTLPAPDAAGWAPLGIRIDSTGRVLVTDVAQSRTGVRLLPAEIMQASSWLDFNPPEDMFGTLGQGNGQLQFPNAAVANPRKGRVYVSDGNNSRISVWDEFGNFQFHFGHGTGDSALSLPRGAAIDERERLYVVDAVGQNVKVFDVAAAEPKFLFAFGDVGLGDGQFNYPNDVAVDANGRVYIADRENNRIQVWSY